MNKDNPKGKESIFENNLLKAQIEWEFEDVIASKKSITMALDNLVVNNNSFDKVIRLSIFNDMFDYLFLKFSTIVDLCNSIDLNNNTSAVTQAFIMYYKNITEGINFNVKDIFHNTQDSYDKSIIFYLIFRLASKECDKYDALKFSYNECKKNLSAAKELYLVGENVEIEALRLLFKVDINLFKLNNANLVIDKNKNNFDFAFLPLGGGNEIGANSYIITLGEYKFIIDAGMKITKDENQYPNYESLKEFIDIVDGVIITHAHLDHCGAVIKLYKLNKKLRFIMTVETRELIKVNLKNSGTTPEELYELESLLQRSIILDYNKPLRWKGKELIIELYKAGHILGAASIFIKSEKCNVFITGDYCLDNQEIVKGMCVPVNERIDVLITENTYGNRNIGDLSTRMFQYESLKQYIVDKINEGKNVLIPAFAIGRGQEIIHSLKELAIENNFRIYVDGSTVEVSDIYGKYSDAILKGRNIHYLKSSLYDSKEEFILEEFMNSRSCVVTSSGMLQEGSTSAVYAKYLLPQSAAACVLTGYQSGDTLGARLEEQMKLDCERYVSIDGKSYKINSELRKFQLSAHCGIDEILALIKKVKPTKIILVHGELRNGTSELLEILKQSRELDVYQSKNSEVIEF